MMGARRGTVRCGVGAGAAKGTVTAWSPLAIVSVSSVTVISPATLPIWIAGSAGDGEVEFAGMVNGTVMPPVMNCRSRSVYSEGKLLAFLLKESFRVPFKATGYAWAINAWATESCGVGWSVMVTGCGTVRVTEPGW